MKQSAYDKLQVKFGKDRVRFGNPVKSGQRTYAAGVEEITAQIDATTAQFAESKETEFGNSTAALRCEALQTYLQRGDVVFIKTATGMGRARFWRKLTEPAEGTKGYLIDQYDPDANDDHDDFDRIGENTAPMSRRY